MISSRLFDVVRCPECASRLSEPAPGPDREGQSRVRCPSCGREYDASRGYLDLRPAAAFAEQTKYLDEALHADARHESVAPPLLGSRIRLRMLQRFLQLAPGDRVLDLGCGSGRTLVWNAESGAVMTGVDISPFFAREALDQCDLLLGDLRRLPLGDRAFDKAWSLDVLEHVSPQALRDVLTEAHRVLAPNGALFVYTHVRKNGWIAGGVRLVNRLAGLCERAGLIDLRQERLRKSDHLNPLADHTDLRTVVGECGFRVERVTYYTPIIGAFVENVLARIAERVMTRRAERALDAERARANAGEPRPSGGPERPERDEGREQRGDQEVLATDRAGGTPGAQRPRFEMSSGRIARTSATARVRRRGALYLALRALTGVMVLDVWLFGRLQSGPFFALLRRTDTGD
jgi:SAM-dependent methyltransferase